MENGDTFERTECPSKLVLRMECEDLECGKRPAVVSGVYDKDVEDDGGHRMAKHGDWPWHVTLIKEGTHVCDGTLVHSNWVMSTKSCFQG